MKTGKGKAIAAGTGLAALAVVLLAAVTMRGWVIEAWYLPKLDSPDVTERRDAMLRLAKMGSVRALPALLRRATSRQTMDGDRDTDEGPLMRLDGVFESYLVLRAVDRIAAARGPAAAPAIAEGLREKDPAVNDALAGYLVRIGPGAIPSLSAALADPDPVFRARVVLVLGKIAPQAPGDVPALLAALADPVKDVRWQAAKALDALGPRARFAVPALVRTLDDPDVEMRYLAAKVLGGAGPPARAAVPALRRALTDPVEDVRDAAAAALRNIRGK